MVHAAVQTAALQETWIDITRRIASVHISQDSLVLVVEADVLKPQIIVCNPNPVKLLDTLSDFLHQAFQAFSGFLSAEGCVFNSGVFEYTHAKFDSIPKQFQFDDTVQFRSWEMKKFKDSLS